MVDIIYLGWGFIAIATLALVKCLVAGYKLEKEEADALEARGELTEEEEEHMDTQYDYVVFLQHFVVTVGVIGVFMLVLGYVFKYH